MSPTRNLTFCPPWNRQTQICRHPEAETEHQQTCRAKELKGCPERVPRAPWEIRAKPETRRSPSPGVPGLACSSLWGVSTVFSRQITSFSLTQAWRTTPRLNFVNTTYRLSLCYGLAKEASLSAAMFCEVLPQRKGHFTFTAALPSGVTTS